MNKRIVFAVLVFVLLGLVVVFGVMGVYRTENGIVIGLPDYEKRDVRVSQVDLEILGKADALLGSDELWRKEVVSDCSLSKEMDLYCALEKASVDVMGRYVHRQPALQEVRFAIDDLYRERWDKHRLTDFNAHKDTSFEDVKRVLSQAIATVKGKLEGYTKGPG